MAELAEKNWDIFISYASEDRLAVALPLAEALRDNDLKVWFDQYEITPGDSLFETIGTGIRDSHTSIVILSPTYFTKEWAQKELRNIYSLEASRVIQRIIPIWYNLVDRDIFKYAPLLSDLVGIKWEYGLDVIVKSVLGAISDEKGTALIPIPFLISGELRKALSRYQYKELVEQMVKEHGRDNVISALNSLLVDFDQAIWIRLRAAKLIDNISKIDESIWIDLFQQPMRDLITGLIEIILDGSYVFSEE